MKTQTIYKSVLALSLGLLASTVSLAQNGYVFKVLGVSGTVKKHTAQGDVPVTAGSKLMAEDALMIDGNGYCGLMHQSGKGLEVKKPGNYPVSDLSKNVVANGKQAKVTDRYVNYVMGQLTKEEAEDINQNHRKYMEVTGSVERGANYRIKLVALSSNEIQPKTYNISWAANAKNPEYQMSVTNLFNETVFSAKTKETSAAVDFQPLFAKHGKNLLLTVSVVGHPEIKSKEYSFKLAPETVTNELGLSEEKSPVNYMVNGMICEEHNLYLDALAYYKEASNLESGVEEYKTAYENLAKRISGAK